LTDKVSNDTVYSGKQRESDREGSERALVAARKALDENENFEYGNAKLGDEFYELGLLTKQERFVAVDSAFSQIKPEERCGPNPPGNISFHPYSGRTLFAFKWNCADFNAVMYLKFCLTGTTGENILVLYSFHKSRPKNDE
jgi:hypothetical protein